MTYKKAEMIGKKRREWPGETRLYGTGREEGENDR